VYLENFTQLGYDKNIFDGFISAGQYHFAAVSCEACVAGYQRADSDTVDYTNPA